MVVEEKGLSCGIMSIYQKKCKLNYLLYARGGVWKVLFLKGKQLKKLL